MQQPTYFKSERKNAVKVIRDKTQGTYTLVPVEEGETETLSAICAALEPGDTLAYGGYCFESPDEETEFIIVNLYAGGRWEKQTHILTADKTWELCARPMTAKEVVRSGMTTSTHDACIGGVHLALHGSTREDKQTVDSIRDACFFREDASTMKADVALALPCNSEEDKKRILKTIRDTCSVKGGLIFRGEAALEGKRAIILQESRYRPSSN